MFLILFMEDCIFCKIANGEIPSHKIYEDEHSLAFLDITPANNGHTLVVPKKHFTNIFEIDDETLSEIMKTVKKVATALGKYSEGVNVLQNNNSAAGQVVNHFHFHIIPRFPNDGVLKYWPTKEYGEGEAAKVAEEIKNLL